MKMTDKTQETSSFCGDFEKIMQELNGIKQHFEEIMRLSPMTQHIVGEMLKNISPKNDDDKK